MQKISLYLKLVNYIPLVIIAVFIFILIMGGMFLFPKWNKLNDTKENIQVKEIELQYKKEYLNKLEELRIKLDENALEISKISSALPVDESVPSVFKFIQETASLSGVTLDRIDQFVISPLEENTKINEIIFTVNLTGAYSSLKEFLYVLEKSSRLFEVNSISLKQNKEGDALAVGLNLKVFSY